MATTARDNQKSRVYRAGWSMPEFEQRMSWPEVERFCQRINESAWYRARWATRITPVVKRGGSGYGYTTGRLTLPLFARTKLSILHEVAHAVLGANATVAPHGPEFCGIYLALVGHFMGADTKRRLREAMRTERVRVKTSAVPRARYVVKPAAEVRQRAAAAKRRPLTASERGDLVSLLRQATAAGAFGPSGRKPRAHALELARMLEKR